MRGEWREILQRTIWIERTEEDAVGVVEDAAVSLGGGTDIDTANGL